MIEFFVKNERKIVLIFGIFVVALVSFTFGVMKSKKFNYEPMVISLPENPPVVINSQDNLVVSNSQDSANNSVENSNKEINTENGENVKMAENMKTCVYVGSKKGSKYYSPSCEYAKKIKPENLRCFSSDDDAKSKGYEKTTSCK